MQCKWRDATLLASLTVFEKYCKCQIASGKTASAIVFDNTAQLRTNQVCSQISDVCKARWNGDCGSVDDTSLEKQQHTVPASYLIAQQRQIKLKNYTAEYQCRRADRHSDGVTLWKSPLVSPKILRTVRSTAGRAYRISLIQEVQLKSDAGHGLGWKSKKTKCDRPLQACLAMQLLVQLNLPCLSSRLVSQASAAVATDLLLNHWTSPAAGTTVAVEASLQDNRQ